jgi:uncharacterized protein YkwD
MITTIALAVLLTQTPQKAEPKSDLTVFREDVLLETNALRIENKLNELALNPVLSQVAQELAEDLARRKVLSHTDSKGRNLRKRIEDAGYDWRSIAENVGSGFQTPAEFVKAWSKSKGHLKNLLDPDAKEIGVGMAKNKNVAYTVQIMASRSDQ